MRFTDFSILQHAIKRIGVDKFETELLEKLKLGELEGSTENTENIVLGKYGIYYLEKGKLLKVILHITDRILNPEYTLSYDAIKNAIKNKDFNNKVIIKWAHKYHFLKCDTLKTMFEAGRKKRYYMAQRMNGKFNYGVIENNKELYHIKEQKLYACQNCLKELSNLTKKQYNVEDFMPKCVLDANVFDDNIVPLSNSEFDLESNAVPNLYAGDWKEIADKAKAQAHYKCEVCGINLTNYKQHLHCHHIDGNRSNNLSINLEVLCIKCHAEKPLHEHMQNKSEYKDF